MALTDEGTNTTMLVQPTYGGMGNGGFGFGGDWAWIILLLLAFGGGWGMGGFGGGYGAMMGMDGFGLYPWLNNSQNINGGFRDQFLNTQIGDLRTDVNRGFGDVQLGIAGVNQNICQTGNGIVNALNSGFSGAEIAANNRQMANMQSIFGVQSALQNCCCENRAATADLKYTIATENCADRAAISDGIRDVMENCNRNNQAVLDKLCALELDNVKAQLAQAQRENVGLQNQINMATMRESQTAQTAQILAGQAAEIDGVYNRLKNCPVGTYSVCNPYIYPGQNNGCGCGNNGFLN